MLHIKETEYDSLPLQLPQFANLDTLYPKIISESLRHLEDYRLPYTSGLKRTVRDLGYVRENVQDGWALRQVKWGSSLCRV